VSEPEQPQPSYEELAALVVGLTSQLERAHARIVELEARLGRDSTNSSQPPSADSIAAKAKRRADRSSRERSRTASPAGADDRAGPQRDGDRAGGV
jgi:transposase